MKNIYTLLVGLLYALSCMSQQTDVVLSAPLQGNNTIEATNSIRLSPGFSFSSATGNFWAHIVNPTPLDFVNYESVINPSTYSINTALAVGKTKGEFQVNGLASYTIPFSVPKGTVGLQPDISLSYLGSNDDGLLGLGWNIRGLSSISRVGQNLYFETQAQPIKGNLTDKYALDGKRLIQTNSSSYSYGTAGSEYGTEIEEFSKIRAKGGAGAGPDWFEVRTKSGLICEYGNTSDSKIIRDGSCILSWKINKITDRYGNYIKFTYFDSDDEKPILQIDYTGNGSTVNPPSQVYFHYKQRTDISTYIYGGKEFTRDLLLDNIEIKNNNRAYKKYQMSFCQVENRTQLQKVTEYSSQNQPLNPTVFSYTQSSKELRAVPTFYTSSEKERVFHGDFNGDGRMDMLIIPSNSIFPNGCNGKLYLANTSGNMVFKNNFYLRPGFYNLLLADFNGDGCCDIVQVYLDSNGDADYNFEYSRSNSDGIFESQYVVSWMIKNVSIQYECTYQSVVDYDGDGILEVMVYDTRNYKVYSASGTLMVSGRVDFNLMKGGITKDRSCEIVDVNGDGCSDILACGTSYYRIYEFKGEGSKLIMTYPLPNQTTIDSGLKVELGDFDNDGNSDILKEDKVHYFSKTSIVNGGISKHDLTGLPIFNLNAQNNRWSIADINGDGLKDIVFFGKGTNTSNTANRINVAFNKGNGYDFSVKEFISTITFDMAYDSDSTNYFNFGDYDGDGFDEFFYSKPGDQCCFSFAMGTQSNLLSKVIDGFGAKTQILYVPMTYAPVYTRDTGAVFPLSDFSSGMPLVFAVAYDNGIGSTTAIHYNYQGAKIHRKGKGFLGFSKITVTNTNTGMCTESNYAFDSPYYYPKLTTSYTKQGGKITSTLENIWGTEFNYGNFRIFPYILSSTQTDRLKGLSIVNKLIYPAENPYGNVDSVIKTCINSGLTELTETTNFVYADEKVSDWLIGRPTSITKTSTNGSDSQIYAVTRTWMPASNDPDVDRYNSGDASWWSLDRDYDKFGNLSKESKSTSGLSTSFRNYNYDPANGVNLLTVYECQGGTGTTTYAWYPATGLLNTQTDPYGNTLTYNYNSADQLYTLVPSTGIAYTISSSFGFSDGPPNARYYVDKTGNDGSETKTWFDKLGRELRTETRKYGGSLVKVDKQYNAKGELAQYSEPTTGTPSSWNIVGHDDDGRVNQIDPVFGATTDYSYSGGTVTRTINSRQYSNTQNAAGWITSTVDPGGTITNSYWPNGQPKSVTTPQGHITSMTYDKNGNRLSITDPSSGNSSNAWYGTGQLKSSTNALGQTTTITYSTDARIQLQSTATPEGLTSYTYYPNGLVYTVTGPNGVTRSYTYELGKVKTITEAVDGLTNVVTYEYDSKGRLSKKYFNGTTEYEQYDYDTNSGYLYRIQFTVAENTSTVWQISSMDDYQRITQATIGSIASTWSYDSSSNLLSGILAPGVQGYSYSFDANTGNLTSRTNSLRTKTDYFGYDTEKLDRLTSVTCSASPTVSVTYTTDKSGNIQTKTDAGTYSYESTPYAVSKITSGLNISGETQTVTYCSFGKIKDITEGTKRAEFIYNADQQRVRMILKTSGTTTRTKYYFGSSCEREVAGGVTTQYIWIGGDAYTAVALAKKVGTGAWTVSNIFRDPLGTITHLKTGITTDEYSFDAWGRRRNATNWTYTLDAYDKALFADRGFTGHEYLDDFKLYNMNGRLYDPVVARFLSPDPVVQDPSFTQSLNRYSYCLNNPLKYNDPSGEFWNLLLVWGGNYVINWLDNSINKKMSPKEAFKQTPIMLSGNYSPSINTFSNYQVEAYKAVVNQEKVWQQLKEVEAKWSGAGSTTNSGDNLLYTVGMGLNAVGFASSAGEYSNVINGSWKGVNGKWNSLEWGGNQWTGARSKALSKAGYFKLAGRGLFVVGTGISLYQGGDAILKGDYAGAAKSGLDIGMGAFSTFGGPPGWIIGGGYFGLDALGAFKRPNITVPFSPLYYSVPDKTYVAPPVILPQP